VDLESRQVVRDVVDQVQGDADLILEDPPGGLGEQLPVGARIVRRGALR